MAFAKLSHQLVVVLKGMHRGVCVCVSISSSMSIQHLPFSLQTSIVPRNSFWNVSVKDQVDQHLK